MANCNCVTSPTHSRQPCVECEITQLARNHYFTGKLLVERDFTDEQRYFMGKLRRHNQQLHGWGAVCGLKVCQHTNPACRPQYVIVEPGAAIDCCGREILVTHQEVFDFQAAFLAEWQKQNGPTSQPSGPHEFQICVSYRECPTEDVPAVFDDCSANPASCQPNRILENYAFHVLIDPVKTPNPLAGVQLDWSTTINLANAVRVVRNDATKRLYVLTSQGGNPAVATLYALDADNNSILASVPFNGSVGLDLSVSPEGDFIHLALQVTGQAPRIVVLGQQSLSTTVNTISPVGAATATDAIRLATIPGSDTALLAVVPSQKGVLYWSDATSGNSSTLIPTGTNPTAIAVNEKGAYAYVANSGSANVSAIPLANLPNPTVTQVSAGFSATAAPSEIAVATNSQGDSLAVIDASAAPNQLYIVGIPSAGPTAIGSPITLTNTSLAVLFAPGGRWIYVLEEDASGSGYVQVVDAYAAQQNQPAALANPAAVAVDPVGATLSDDGSLLYVPYAGAQNVPGGVAVINVLGANCPDIFKEAVEPCPHCHCAEGNCIVLATVKGYNYSNNDSVVDPTTQPPGADQLDNFTDRQILASTELLTKVVRCLLEQGGGSSQPGPQTSGNQPSGPPFVAIQSISWQHGGQLPVFMDITPTEYSVTLAVAFTGNVQFGDISPQSVALLAGIISDPGTGSVAYAEVPATVQAGNFNTPGDASNFSTTFTAGPSPQNYANGLTISYSGQFLSGVLWIRIRGDFIRDSIGRAIDADHLPPWLMTLPPVQGQRTGDGVQGGTFESWVTQPVQHE